jgi:hypothetical protein
VSTSPAAGALGEGRFPLPMPEPTPPFDPLPSQEPEGKRGLLAGWVLFAVADCSCLVGWLVGWVVGWLAARLACVSRSDGGYCSVGALGLAGAQRLLHRTPSALQPRRPHWGWILLAQRSPPLRTAAPTGAGTGKPAAAAVKWLLTPAALSTAAKLCRCLVL